MKGSWNNYFIELMLTYWASYLAWWPMRIGHPWVDILSLFCFGFPYFSYFSDFPSFLNFHVFHTFLLFLFYLAFWIYAAFPEIFLFSHFWKHFWTLVLTWLDNFISTSFNCIINKNINCTNNIKCYIIVYSKWVETMDKFKCTLLIH